jgi:hypothetical protein
MAALTETYVDPVSGNDTTGDGSIGTPWATVQKALDTITRDSTNGDRINVKDSGDDTSSAPLDFTTYGTTLNNNSPLVIQGYTSAAGDGGIGGLSGGGSVSIQNTVNNYVHYFDMHLHNCGSAAVISAATQRYSIFANCEIDNTSGDGINIDINNRVIFCHIHNIGGYGVRCRSDVAFCYLANGTNDFNAAIYIDGTGQLSVFNNVINIDGSSDGIVVFDRTGIISNNSVYSSSGTGTGINCHQGVFVGNVVEGFSGVGGIGLDITAVKPIVRDNYFYNNTTKIGGSSGSAHILWTDSNNTTLGSSPFTNAGAGDFTVTTDVKALGFPVANYPGLSLRSYLDIGALQRKEPGGVLRVQIE